MSKIKKAKCNMIISLAMVFALIINVIPVSALTLNSTYTTNPKQAITESDVNANQYETYYYTDGIDYTYQGKSVEFTSEEEIKVDGETLNLKNKKTNISKTVEDNTVSINFSNLSVPVDYVQGEWNSSYEGDYRIVYKTDIEGKEEVRSEHKDLNTLVIGNLQPGTYHLTEGTIYEEANSYSPGIIGIGDKGFFGALPNITIEVKDNTVESEEKVKISIEKRTIGKGDTLSLQEVELQEGDTAWKVLERVTNENNIPVEKSGSGSSLYVSSIDGDGEFEHGNGSGWKYEVNGEFPKVGLDAYNLKKDDVIRLRYCVTVDSEELKNPLVKYLGELVDEAIVTLNKGNYTEDSKNNLQKSIDEAKAIINDEKYNSKETDIELIVSEHIAKINVGVENLAESEGPSTEDDINNVPNDFSNDLWLQYDFKEMKVGETTDIYPRRIPQIVGSSILNDVHRPNFNFEIVKGDSIALSTNDSDEKSIVTAKKEGTTIVKVTYDETIYNGRNYGASSKVNTAYAIFNVQDKDNDIKISTDIKQDSYDTIYFKDGNSTDLTFKVNTTNAENIVVTCNDEVLTKNGDSYTAKLRNRSNIIGVKATNSKGETKSYYKVVDARKIEIDTYNKTNPGKEIGAGDTVQISFKGISNPVAKLATIYNPTFLSQWEDNKGTFVEYKNDKAGVVKGYCSQWDLDKKNTIEVKFDEKGTYDFSGGRIFSEWWGSELGTDKVLQGSGDPNLGAPVRERYFSKMPDFSIKVGDKNSDIHVTEVNLNKDKLSLDEGKSERLQVTVGPEFATNKKVTWSSSNNEIAKVDENGNVTAIKAGIATITVTTEDGGLTDTCTVTVTSTEKAQLRNLIDEANKLEQSKYTKESWEVMQKELEKAKNILSNEDSTKDELTKAKQALKDSIDKLVLDTWSYTVEPKDIYPGTEVIVTIPEVPQPSLLPVTVQLQTIYDTNIEGLKSVYSENAVNNPKVLKTVKFTIPENTQPGEYSMTNGHVYLRSGQFGSGTYFKDKMPRIDLEVKQKTVPPVDTTEGIKHAADWTIENVKNPGYKDEWDILGLVRGNVEVPGDFYKTYYNNLVEVLKEKDGELHKVKYTEYSRVIIALTALGYNPTDVGGYNLVEKLYDFNKVSKQGINGVIFALIALDTKDFEIKGDLNSREMMVNYIIEKQLEDGGFALSGDKGEIDITAMAIQALAKYKDQEDVKPTIDKAIKFLSDSQLETGGFKAEGTFFKNILKTITNNDIADENVESAAQVLVAINALGIDNTDSRFVKNGKTIVDNIMTFKVENGGFKHLKSEENSNSIATEQVLYSLVSQNRLENKKTSLYDMSDITEVGPETPEVNENPIINASDIELTVGDEFDEMANVTATDKEDGDITKDIKVVENTVNTEVAGEYKVVYEVSDSKGLKATKEIKVSVKEKVLPPQNEAPVINAKDVELVVGDEFDVMANVTATDKEDGNLTDRIVIDGVVDTSKAGIYELVYKVVDNDGLETTKKITVIVKEAQKPTDKKLKVGVYTDDKALYESIEVEYKEGDTAYTVLKRLLGDKVDSTGTGETLYVQGIDGLAEFDKGAQSGWVYAVNRKMPNVSAGIFDINEGDEIIWHYTLDLGKDITKSYAKFDKFIEEEGENPPPPINTAPVINAVDVELNIGDKFDPMAGVTAIDKEDGDLTSEIKVDDKKVSTNLTGVYEVTYEVTDSGGLKTTKKIKVTVRENKIPEEDKVDVSGMIKHASDWVLANVKEAGYEDEWKVLGLKKGNVEIPNGYYENYYNDLVKVLKEKKGELHRVKYTEYSRVIIALTALGYDPTDVGEYNLVEKLYDLDVVSKQGINGVIFALIALDTKDFKIEGNKNSRDMMVDYIIEKQLSDGGFALAGETSEIDMTAMAIQALSKYKEQDKVKASIDKALAFLSKSQLANGGFGTNEGENLESSAQVLVALNELGLSAKDERFTKNGKTVIDAMDKFKAEGGGFKHLADGNVDSMATEQALYSLVSQDRLNKGKTSLYDMSDEVNNKPPTGGGSGSGSGGSDNNGNSGSGSGSSGSNNNGNSGSSTSPQTSDTSIMPLVFMFIVALAGIFVINRKKIN